MRRIDAVRTTDDQPDDESGTLSDRIDKRSVSRLSAPTRIGLYPPMLGILTNLLTSVIIIVRIGVCFSANRAWKTILGYLTRPPTAAVNTVGRVPGEVASDGMRMFRAYSLAALVTAAGKKFGLKPNLTRQIVLDSVE